MAGLIEENHRNYQSQDQNHMQIQSFVYLLLTDPELKTNQPYGRKSRCEVARPCSTRSFYFSEKQFEPSLRFEKGQAFGHFSMGSTIVLIFEAPKEFSFSKGIDQRVIVGAAL